MMDFSEFSKLIREFETKTILVIGDFFLDKYLHIERSLSEVSLETGLEVYQVVATNSSPGAAGNVAANLASLGVKVLALSCVGDDGNGYELKRCLKDLCVDTSALVEVDGFFTPTYTKPIVHETDGMRHEIERLDIKNRSVLPENVENVLLEHLWDLLPAVDGVVIADQVQETDQGVVTRRVRQEINQLAKEHTQKPFVVDSRTRVGLFRNTFLKPNALEAINAVHPQFDGEITPELAIECGSKLQLSTNRDVFLTMGADGILLINGSGIQKAPAFPVTGEIDIVGAGDTCIAAITTVLCSGGTSLQAAQVGNLASSITIQKIGTTGTATVDELVARYKVCMGLL